MICLIVAVLLLWRQPRIGASDSGASARIALVPASLPEPLPADSGERPPTVNAGWNAKAAGAYLDQRAGWWMGWSKAQRDHETFCISCHTAVPYAMARARLRGSLGEQGASPAEQRLIENVTKRVRLWKEVAPFYSDADRGEYKTVESRGTEAVLNALVLASHDAQNGQLSEDARTAFANMWAEQEKSGERRGAWQWLRFKNEPWEADDSDFYGAALGAIATGIAPGDYRERPEIQSNLKLLRDYLQSKAAGEPLMNRVVLLWASAKVPGLVEPELQRAIVAEVFAKQEADGGWNLPALAGNWSRHDNTPQDVQSDGYATGLIVYAMEQFAPGKEPGQARWIGEDISKRVNAGRNWLASHQDAATGYWPSASLNKSEANHIGPETVRFMNDAATAYSVMALTNGRE